MLVIVASYGVKQWPTEVLARVPRVPAGSTEAARLRKLISLCTLLHLYQELVLARERTGGAGDLSMAASKSGLPVRLLALCPAIWLASGHTWL